MTLFWICFATSAFVAFTLSAVRALAGRCREKAWNDGYAEGRKSAIKKTVSDTRDGK